MLVDPECRRIKTLRGNLLSRENVAIERTRGRWSSPLGSYCCGAPRATVQNRSEISVSSAGEWDSAGGKITTGLGGSGKHNGARRYALYQSITLVGTKDESLVLL